MVAWRRGFALIVEDEDLAKLRTIARSRSEPANRVQRAQMLLAYRDNPCYFAVAHELNVHHQTVQRCVERAVACGPILALEDRPRPGKEPTITAEAKAWLVSLACEKAKDYGYPHELWTTRLLARHAREHGPAAGLRMRAPNAPQSVIVDSLQVFPRRQLIFRNNSAIPLFIGSAVSTVAFWVANMSSLVCSETASNCLRWI